MEWAGWVDIIYLLSMRRGGFGAGLPPLAGLIINLYIANYRSFFNLLFRHNVLFRCIRRYFYGTYEVLGSIREYQLF
jgi:hypothetical protein